MKKRLISLLLAFSMMLTFLPAGAVSAFAEGTWGPYDCGETPRTVTATLSSNNDGTYAYTMTIRGTGPMKNYSFYTCSETPWYDVIPYITRLIVDKGVTSLGDRVIHGFDGWHDAKSLKEVTLPEALLPSGRIDLSRRLCIFGCSQFNKHHASQYLNNDWIRCIP